MEYQTKQLLLELAIAFCIGLLWVCIGNKVRKLRNQKSSSEEECLD